MADVRLVKLARKLRDSDLATLLFNAGLMTPGAVRDADNSVVEEAVGSENVAAVRSRLAYRGQ